MEEDSMDDINHEDQREFEETYITSAELTRVLGITRATLVAMRKRNWLPPSISLPGSRMRLWKRSMIQDRVDAYKLNLQARRGEL